MRVLQMLALLVCAACKTGPSPVASDDPATCDELCARASELHCTFSGEMCPHMCFAAVSSGLYRPMASCVRGSPDCAALDRCVL